MLLNKLCYSFMLLSKNMRNRYCFIFRFIAVLPVRFWRNGQSPASGWAWARVILIFKNILNTKNNSFLLIFTIPWKEVWFCRTINPLNLKVFNFIQYLPRYLQFYIFFGLRFRNREAVEYWLVTSVIYI